MSLLDRLVTIDVLPERFLRKGARWVVARRERELHAGSSEEQHLRLRRWLATLRDSPVAIDTDAANAQHYEVPAAFFERVLGPELKYSCGLWTPGVTDLTGAERAMLDETVARARLADGQDILELGCGWGSLTLWMARAFPNAKITAISNSQSQRAFIEKRAATLGITNVQIITADINDFDIQRTFDRVVSVEMFEHVRNYETLLSRIARWLRPAGLLFVHHFCHAFASYPYEDEGEDDWMTRHFFTGGQMPARDSLLYFQRDLNVIDHWSVCGTHYEKTSNAWLANMVESETSLRPVFRGTYGPDAQRFWVYWRLFFIAVAELFAYRGGNEWFVTHVLMQKPA